MSDTLKDIRNITIEKGDVVGVSYYNYDEEKPCIEVAVVVDVSSTKNCIYLDDGEPIELSKFDVIVLPDDYEG